MVPFDEYVKAATITIRHGVFQLISLFWTLLLKYLLVQQIAFVITLKRFEVNLQAHKEICKDHLNDDNRIELVSWSHWKAVSPNNYVNFKISIQILWVAFCDIGCNVKSLYFLLNSKFVRWTL